MGIWAKRACAISNGADALRRQDGPDEPRVCFVPGDRPERFYKAWASAADEVILDLEDAVAPAHGWRRAVALDGRMVDRPVALKAQRIADSSLADPPTRLQAARLIAR